MSDIQVKPGYKRTQVGVIPEDWDLKRVADFTDCTAGGTPSTRIKAYWGGEIPWMSSGELHKKVVSHVEGKITEEGLRNSNAKLLPPNCVLIGLAGQGKTRGTVAINTIPLCTNQSIAAILPSPKFEPKYLFYNLENRYLELRDLSSGEGGRGGLNLTIIRNIHVPLPPLPEQRAIAQVLSDVDAWIEALGRLIAKKRAVKQAAMEELLTGQVRLPGFVKKSGYKRTDIGSIPADWEVKRIGDVLSLRYGQSPKGIMVEDGFYPVIGTSGEIGKTNQFLYDKPSIIIGRKGTINTPQYVDVPFWPIDTTFYSVIFNSNSPTFLFYLLLTINWLHYNEASGVPSLNANTILGIKIPVPPFSEQQAIAKVLSDMDAEIEALERQREKAAAIKQGLMQELLTGRIRLVKRKTPVLRIIKGKRTQKQYSHSWAFNEAVVIATLANRFADKRHPLGRKRYTKLAYLLHRYANEDVGGYLPKAAGPYNPRTRYAGPEKIALEKDYVRWHIRGPYEGFVAGEKTAEAEKYFRRWYGLKALQWLDQFRYKSNDELELLTTVDMAVEELKRAGKPITVETVKEFIRNEPEWTPKLERPFFSDDNIARAIKDLDRLFDTSEE